MKSILKTRRRFLHLTAAGGLLAPFFDQLQALAATDKILPKVAFVFFPHGTPNTSGFWPGDGPVGNLSGVLAPLQAHKGRLLSIGGLSGGMDKGYGHQGGNTSVLTSRGSNLKEDGYYIPNAASVDWLIARHLKQEPLVLGNKAASGARHLISWAAANKAGATPAVNDPAEGFKRVFGRVPKPGACTTGGGLPPAPTNPGTAGPSADPDVLDVVAADLNALKADLPSWSRAALDEQLDAISDLQAEVKAAGEMPSQPADPVPVPSAGGTSEGCYAAGTTDYYVRSDFMADLIVAAFQAGTRRVAVFQHGAASGDSFAVPGYGGYHGEVHNLSSGKTGDLNRVTKMQTEIFKGIGYFVDRLAATKDMSGAPLLNSTLVYICTEFSLYSASSDPHNTGAGFVVNLVGASDYFQTTGKGITVKGPVGGVLSHAAKYLGAESAVGTEGKFAPIAGIAKG